MPVDNAPALHAFGPHAHRVATLLGHQPHLAARLLCAPRRALHSMAAYLGVADGTDAEVAARLYDDDPRVLLAVAIPGAPARLYRSLDRAGNVARDLRYYQRLGRIAMGPFNNMLFGSRGTIDDRMLTHIETVAAMQDGALHALPVAVLADPSLSAAVASIVALLRAHGRDPDPMLRSFPASASLRAVTRRLVELVSELEAPLCPVPLPYPYRQVRSIGELRTISMRHEMCMSSGLHGGGGYWLRLLERSVFLVSEEPFFLAEIERLAPGLWWVREVRDVRNHVPPADVRNRIRRDLQAMGFQLAEMAPRDALTCLSARTNGAFQRAEREFGRHLAAEMG